MIDEKTIKNAESFRNTSIKKEITIDKNTYIVLGEYVKSKKPAPQRLAQAQYSVSGERWRPYVFHGFFSACLSPKI